MASRRGARAASPPSLRERPTARSTAAGEVARTMHGAPLPVARREAIDVRQLCVRCAVLVEALPKVCRRR